MIRFFADTDDISENSIKLSPEDADHIRVLRLRPDEQFIICDGNGTDYICRLGDRTGHSTAKIIDQIKSPGEPDIKCKVYMAYSKGDRLDYAVQKSVELGAHEIILFESGRCVAVPHDIPKKIARLQKISLETAKQCNRGIIPKVSHGGSFDSIITDAAGSSGPAILFYEQENNLHIKEVLEQQFPPVQEQKNIKTSSISIITGPEGGFETHEIKHVQSKDIRIVSLGPRILRSETAPVAALAAIMYQTGNL